MPAYIHLCTHTHTHTFLCSLSCMGLKKMISPPIQVALNAPRSKTVGSNLCSNARTLFGGMTDSTAAAGGVLQHFIVLNSKKMRKPHSDGSASKRPKGQLRERLLLQLEQFDQ